MDRNRLPGPAEQTTRRARPPRRLNAHAGQRHTSRLALKTEAVAAAHTRHGLVGAVDGGWGAGGGGGGHSHLDHLADRAAARRPHGAGVVAAVLGPRVPDHQVVAVLGDAAGQRWVIAT